MKRFLLVFTIASTLFVPRLNAEEGMWLLPMIGTAKMTEMKDNGLELSARHIKIASTFKTGVSASVIQFGNKGTGALISPEGLVITNHHCAYDYIHDLSSSSHNLLSDGFWAKTKNEEIPVPGLAITFVRYMGLITDEILEGVDDVADSDYRENAIEANRNKVLLYYRNVYKEPDLKFSITNYFDGKEYILTITQTFNDVRLVGTPPESIGKFGGEDYNWQWPRYTGDFAMFRIYTAPDGSPSAYKNNNIPYKAKSHITVSKGGYSEGDFAMVLGFPASTQRNYSESDLNFFIENRIRPMTEVRGELLEIMKSEMEKDVNLKTKYASKYNGFSNFYLKYSGMLEGIEKYGVYKEAQVRDNSFAEWADKAGRRSRYGKTLDVIKNYNNHHAEYSKAYEYVYETLFSGMDLLILTQRANRLRSNPELVNDKSSRKVEELVNNIYKDYDSSLDRKLAHKAFSILMDRVPKQYWPDFLVKELDVSFKGNVSNFVDYMFERTAFKSAEHFMKEWNAKRGAAAWGRDYALQLLNSVQRTLHSINSNTINAKDNGDLLKKYQAAEANYTETLRQLGVITYPNANRTMRLSYGDICGYETADRGKQAYYTTLDGTIDAAKRGGYKVPAKLIELYEARDFADYAVADTLMVNFLTSTDITGGNSGSPVLDASGEMIGLVLDSNWESLVGDVSYKPETNRGINVDMRYILFIIDKYAGAGHLLDEMKLSLGKTDEEKEKPFEADFKY